MKQKQVLACYVCDFGPVLRGTVTTQRIRLQNVGAPLQINLQKMPASGAFEYAYEGKDPPTMLRIGSGGADLELRLMGGKPDLPEGACEHLLELDIRGGPSVHVLLRGEVATPEVVVSTESLSFGSVPVGQARCVGLHLRNPGQVPAEWSLKRVGEITAFTADCEGGMLAPGEMRVLRVTFTPGTERVAFFSKLVVRVTGGKRDCVLACSGAAVPLVASLTPGSVDLGAVLPGAAPREERVVLRNESDLPIEVFSLDFDTKYLADEEVLRGVEGYDSHGQMLRKPREPGTGLWPDILEAHAKRVAAEKKAAAAARAAAVAAGFMPQSEDSNVADSVGGTPTSSHPGRAGSRVGDAPLEPPPPPQRAPVPTGPPAKAPPTSQGARGAPVPGTAAHGGRAAPVPGTAAHGARFWPLRDASVSS